MARSIGRRALFFLAATLVCLALVPATPPELRWVTWITAGIGGFWTLMLVAEDLFGQGPVSGGERQAPREGSTPFAPPPPPGRSA